MLRHVLLAMLLVLLAGLATGWMQRRQLANDAIANALAERGVEASYQVDSIGPKRQVLSNIVIGDPQRPDLTIERMIVEMRPRFGLPAITHLHLVRPRLFGSLHAGTPSFGALDPFILSGSDEPFEFPDMELTLDDGRALLETDYGRVGLKLSGSGHLRGGFRGELAAVAPALAGAGCTGREVTLYGEVAIDAERPEFHGPLRFASMECEASELTLRDAGAMLDLQAERNLAEYEGRVDFTVASAVLADMRAQLGGQGRFTWRDDSLDASYDLSASNVATPFASASALALDGRLRALGAFAQVEVEADLIGENLQAGPRIEAMLEDARAASLGTLLAPLLARVDRNLSRNLVGSRLTASFTARQQDQRASLSVPEAILRGGSGEIVLALSHGQVSMGEGGLPLFSGNFQTGGAGLPRIRGRMEQATSGALELRMTMQDYRAGDSSLALREMRLLQGRGGELSLSGRALASGPVPGGMVTGLEVPIDAVVSAGGNLAMWRGCRDVRFESLSLASLSLGRQSLTLCPQAGGPIQRHDANGPQFAAGTQRLQLAGTLADTPITIATGPVAMAWPGTLLAHDIAIDLGPHDNLQRFEIAQLSADLSGDSLRGEFSGAKVSLASVPLDILGASGKWAYANDRLVLSDGELRVEDRESPDRFEPLVAHGASLSLFDNRISADAVLREPFTDRAITQVSIVHDLATGAGHANLIVDNLTFDDDLQLAPSASRCLDRSKTVQVRPFGLSCLAFGVVSQVSGSVSGTGRIDWNQDGVSSSGRIAASSLDLAAPFGPVRGVSGTVVFTDLLALTTLPDQRITVASINPGVEVLDGIVSFQLLDGEMLRLHGGTWPFMGGTLKMRPVDIRFGVEEVRAYVIEIEGLEAAQFVEQMEFNNLAASGTFDGVVPIIFDERGNGRLEGGLLTSRPPGGHVAYVGELTYEDMGFFANYAFSALRDLSYDRTEILMNGPLTGELVTQVRFEGVGQGETAQSNIVTRAIARLPIELRINIRAPFYKLLTSIRALYDPAAIRDPRSLGLISDDGTRLRVSVDQQTIDEAEAAAAAQIERQLRQATQNDEPDIQPQESEPAP